MSAPQTPRREPPDPYGVSGKPLAPFSAQYSPQIPELLTEMGCSLALSTYQAGKVVLLSPASREQLSILPRDYDQATALWVSGSRMAVASQYEITLLENRPDLAPSYPPKPNTYDALYHPLITYHTGPLALHGLTVAPDGRLWGVNTLFSCLSVFDGSAGFIPQWKPPFIKELKPEDKCHLNGLACLPDGTPRYVTAFNRGEGEGSWRTGNYKNGLVMDIRTNEILADGLAMPHSPLLLDGKLYLLLSATGELLEINPADGAVTRLAQRDSYLRGLDYHKGYLFIGESKIRENSSTFRSLEIAPQANTSGIYLYHLATRSWAGKIELATSVDEIFDIKVLPGMLRPNILNTRGEIHQRAITLPRTSYWAADRPPEQSGKGQPPAAPPKG